MELLVYLAAAVAYSVFAAYTSGYWAATQYWGLKLTYSKSTINALLENQRISHYIKTIDVNGLQSAITPTGQRVRSYFRFGLNFVFFIVGAAYFPWYVPMVTLFGILLLKNMIRQFFQPAASLHYLHKIINDLRSESAHFERSMKLDRKQQVDFFIEQLEVMAASNQSKVQSDRLRPPQNSRVPVPEVPLLVQNHSQQQ